MDEQTVSSVPIQTFNVTREMSKCLELCEEKRLVKAIAFCPPWAGLLLFRVSNNFAFSFVSLELDDEVQLCVNECHLFFCYPRWEENNVYKALISRIESAIKDGRFVTSEKGV